MNRLYIEPTRSTPLIDFDPQKNQLIIKGQSYPENSFKFYEVIYSWIDEYLEQINLEIVVEIQLNLPYINTSSTKCIMIILDKFQAAYDDGKKITINWYYDKENEIELECAEEFKEDVTIPFNILPITS